MPKIRQITGGLRFVVLLLAIGLASVLNAQTLANFGATAPTPGTNDIYQLSTQGNKTSPDGLNYFTDNQTSFGSGEPGQTFTTGTNGTGYVLTSVAFRTGGIGTSSGTTTPQPYYLHIYSISGSTATLLQTYTSSNITFNDGDWLKWTGFSVRLLPNATYAYSFGKASSTTSWEPMAVATNKYSGGEIAMIPTAGGTITTGSSHTFDAVFDLGLQMGPTNIPASMPLPLPTYGWNLGNTLEATWGVPGWSAAPFYTAANAGFNAVRIPCAWDFNSTTNVSGGVTNYVINPAFMAQVKQAVDDGIAAGMYVVMNDHWDDGWLENHIGTNVDATINAKMKSYWTQIATTFAGYDNHLLFAAANEPNVSSPAAETTLMFYYQTFVNAVRAAGGNNTNRWLVLQSVSDPTWLNALPTDTVSNRIMVEYHQYTPSLFCFIHTDQTWGNAIYFWGKAYHYSGDPGRNATFGEENEIDAFHQQLNDLYVSKGIPVLIGEFGAWSASLTNAAEAAWNDNSAAYWNKYVAESARAHGLSPFYWSTANSIFDWTTGAVNDAQRISVLTGGAAPPPTNGYPYAPSGLTTIASSNQVILSWTAGSGATSYNLYRSTASGVESTVAPVITGITGTSYTNTGLSAGTVYYYQVAGVNASGTSGFSPEVRVTTSGTGITDPAQYNFESSTQGWSGGGGIVSGIATSTAQHYGGNQSLAVNFNGAAAGTATISVGNVSINPGTTITFQVWIPSGSKVTALQPYIQDRNNTWTSSWYGSFTPNAWNTITVTVPANAATPLNGLGVQIFTSGAWTGTCYIDSVSWPTSGPDFSLMANPTSLTINGGTNGMSTVTVTPLNGLNAAYTLSVSNLPSGVSATFTNNPSSGGTSLLTLTASNSVVSGTTNVTVIATAGLISHTQTIALTLNAVTQPNTSPTLTPIPDQTVNVGQTVAFTTSATDTDQPPQTLTFSLLAGSGTATLNAGTGAFSWTPQPSDAGTTNLFTIKVADNGTPSLSATQSFSVMVNKQTPVLTAPVASVITYGQTLAGSILSGGAATNSVNNASVAGSFAFTTPATAPGAGTASQSVTFTPTDVAHYNPATVNVSVTVNKRTPVLTAPVAAAITYGQTLASSSLSGGAATNSANNASVAGSFAFTTPTIAPGAGTANQSVTFTPTDTANYNPTTVNVAVTVGKQTPVLMAPVATTITYGQTLTNSSLSGGAATNSANNASVAGSFAFTTPATAPGAGTANQSVTFTPTDTANYNPATVNVSVMVVQASPTFAFSSSKSPAGYNAGVIFTASLPTDATGNVNFLTNGVLFDVRTLSGGSATSTNSTLPTGTNLITAIYSGDSNYLGRTNALNQVVTNAPPVLAAISDQAVNVGQTVAFTASATDADSPQTLTFALLAGATNATLNTNSGAFSFRPLVTQADSTNSFTLQVSDNGTPSLSATQSFTVTVNPLSAPGMSSVSVAGGRISISVSGQSGPDYGIETSTNLTQWSNVLVTNSPALPFTWTDAATNSPQRFYRIKLGPPLP